MPDFRFRPIDGWPGQLRTDTDRESPRFTARYPDTLEVLDRELDQLDARLVVIQLALSESDIRRDGLPRATARPAHPGVIVSFESKHGPLRYLTDQFTGRSVWRAPSEGGSWHMPGWQANLRAIALGLEALRTVDRYGITKRGEQYRGWAELPAGIAAPPTHLTTDEAAAFIAEHANMVGRISLIVTDKAARENAYRRAAKNLHPDRGGDPALFQQLQAAKALLGREAGR